MPRISPKAAELLGMHAGDGTLYRVKNSLVWELRGDIKERDYYLNHILPLLNSLFSIDLPLKFRNGGKNGCIGVQTTNKEITSFFLNNSFLPGKKSNIVRIPAHIKKSSKPVLCAFIRGLFDTDGCLRFDKINKNTKHDYPKIEIGSISENLINDLAKSLSFLGFNYYTWTDRSTMTFKLCIAGKTMLNRWIEVIKPGNSKHLNKYLLFKESGFMPDAGVA